MSILSGSPFKDGAVGVKAEHLELGRSRELGRSVRSWDGAVGARAEL